MANYRSLLVLILVLSTMPARAGDWSFTKIITIHHLGDPSENDGFHPVSFVFEKSINEQSYYSIGLVENSEERTGLTLGYSKIFRQGDKYDLTGNIYLSSNYKRLPVIMPIPTMGVRYHLNKRIDLLAEALPVPDREPYVIFMTGINYDW